MFFPLVWTQSSMTHCPWLLSLQQSLFSLFCVAQERFNPTTPFYFHSLITLANRAPSGLANIVDGWHSEGNIYTIEENIYEMEDPSEYYCSVLSGPPSWQPLGSPCCAVRPNFILELALPSLKSIKCVSWFTLSSCHGHWALFFHFLKTNSSQRGWTVTCTVLRFQHYLCIPTNEVTQLRDC